MGDMKDKFKGFVKKVNNPFTSSSSGKFKGQGRVLGNSTSSSSSSSSSLHDSRNMKNNSNLVVSNKNIPQNNNMVDQIGYANTFVDQKVDVDKLVDQKIDGNKLVDQKVDDNGLVGKKFDDNEVVESRGLLNERAKMGSGFDPYDALITSGERNRNGYELKVFECPICGRGYTSEEEVSEHVESCLSSSEAGIVGSVSELGLNERGGEEKSDLEACVAGYLSGKPTEGSVEVVLKLLRNVVSDPGNSKFRRIRMGNGKIREAIGDVAGGVELLEFIGFELKEDEGEMFAVMDYPSEEGIGKVKNVVTLLEGKKGDDFRTPAPATMVTEPVKLEPKRVDRQMEVMEQMIIIRVFFSISENVAAKFVVPDSFFNLSSEELKREAEMRRRKIDESKLLIPKSYREKQAKAARKRYNRTIIRVQFPDGVVLQGVFLPSELTSALYEFVSSALKEPSLEFDLLHPVLIKRRVIPHSPAPGEKAITLEEEDLVPAALIKFRPIETDSIVFTGLCNELLEISEPLTTESAVPS
ncbi:hypothetical protein Leryth_021709 [Lithospermum erythrorhizon]|nr:hypothetical protein Leryth_021709 [Lithospermum erythrorhizon]